MSGEDSRIIQIGRRRISVSDRAGTDPAARPLLLLMGLGGNVDMWEPLRSKLVEAGGMRTIAFDIPGTGRSPASALPRPLALLSRLALRVLDELDVDEVDVFGLSWGGLLAQQLAITAPRRVRRVVLANTNFGLGSFPGGVAAMRALFTPQRYHSADAFTRAARAFGGHDTVVVDAGNPHAVARLAHPPSARGYYYQLFAPLGWSSLTSLRLLRQQTLVLAGDADLAIPVVNARILSALIPHARLHILSGGGHLVLFQRPDEVAAIVDGFLAEDRVGLVADVAGDVAT